MAGLLIEDHPPIYQAGTLALPRDPIANRIEIAVYTQRDHGKCIKLRRPSSARMSSGRIIGIEKCSGHPHIQ
jgi:hypothetical protein